MMILISFHLIQYRRRSKLICTNIQWWRYMTYDYYYMREVKACDQDQDLLLTISKKSADRRSLILAIAIHYQNVIAIMLGHLSE